MMVSNPKQSIVVSKCDLVTDLDFGRTGSDDFAQILYSEVFCTVWVHCNLSRVMKLQKEIETRLVGPTTLPKLTYDFQMSIFCDIVSRRLTGYIERLHDDSTQNLGKL